MPRLRNVERSSGPSYPAAKPTRKRCGRKSHRSLQCLPSANPWRHTTKASSILISSLQTCSLRPTSALTAGLATTHVVPVLFNASDQQRRRASKQPRFTNKNLKAGDYQLLKPFVAVQMRTNNMKKRAHNCSVVSVTRDPLWKNSSKPLPVCAWFFLSLEWHGPLIAPSSLSECSESSFLRCCSLR